MRKSFPYHDVIMFRIICTLWLRNRRCKSLSIFSPGAFPSSWQQMMQYAWEKCWFIAPYFLNHNLELYFLSLMTWITNLNYTHPGLGICTSWWSKVLKVKNILVACSIWGLSKHLPHDSVPCFVYYRSLFSRHILYSSTIITLLTEY